MRGILSDCGRTRELSVKGSITLWAGQTELWLHKIFSCQDGCLFIKLMLLIQSQRIVGIYH